MNQILITGEEQVAKRATQGKEKKVVPIKGIVIFYAISIIILGICMISGSVYAGGQINKEVEARIKPEISVERNDDNKTIEINVKHIRELKNVTYQWNNEEIITIDANNSKNINETIDLIGGTNTLVIVAIDENGQTSTLKKIFIAANIPEVKILEAVDNGIKVYAESEEIIDYLLYSWDDEEAQKIRVGEKQYEGIINAPKGQHTLKIEVVDKNGIKAELKQNVVGDTEPTVIVKSKRVNGKPTFVIDAEDDEGIKTVSIIHNGGEEKVITVNNKTYHEEITMTEGEENTIIVIVTNKYDLQKIRGVRFDNI